jgi:hypothetical protein
MSMNATRNVVVSYPDYVNAEWAVHALSDRGFPVERLAIVGANLQSMEQITGRRGYGRAAVAGLSSGAVVGLLVGWLLGLFSLVAPLTSVLFLGVWGLVIGAIVGVVVGLIGHALAGGRRDFSSISTVRAERYDVLADVEVADDARRMIEELGRAGAGRGGREL